MNWIDLVFVALIVVSGLISLYRGFVREIFSLATWVVAIWVGIRFAGDLAVLLPEAVHDTTLRLGIAFAALFILVLIVGGIAGVLAMRLVRGSGLTGTDRSLGVVFGLLRGVLIVALLVFLASLTLVPEEPWWQQSRLVPEFERLVAWLVDLLPEGIQERLRDLDTEVEA
ncbi:Colicin V production protein [Thioalkalivibrio nitratireducens DSM 14787]|uniref:Colicin V production protein n=1 Tax=Thioalkalivibrio nitratireducens (strain DSM 14787 / UNIQEM 213 / ALEN2) TaxID=1255043 RepID=L0DV53_THIND|nr:CvpA family protein [Thioalkalivibrio nitratireducens]AGA32898.1 Colicin V production protein [Thioalkalivibrio nitratireducens DSM 14787]